MFWDIVVRDSTSIISKLREVIRVYSLRRVYNILMGTLQLWLRSSKLYYLATRKKLAGRPTSLKSGSHICKENEFTHF